MFARNVFTRNYSPPWHNKIENDKKKLFKEEIILGNCRGHDTIIIFFHFDGFYEQFYGFNGFCCLKLITLDKK